MCQKSKTEICKSTVQIWMSLFPANKNRVYFQTFLKKKNLIQIPRTMPSKTLPIFGFYIIH